jgi:hypothetical protein
MRSLVNGELKRIWKEAVVAYFKAFSRIFPGGSEIERQNLRLASLWGEI